MKLYHGTNTEFRIIDLAKCKPNKDFGRGFYLTDIKKQAVAMAVRRCEREGRGMPIVQEYVFDERLLQSGLLNVKWFDGVSAEWAKFILANRMARGRKVHDYDVVIGPVADDGVTYQLKLYLQHFITIEKLVEELTYRKLNSKYLFGTPKAISHLIRL